MKESRIYSQPALFHVVLRKLAVSGGLIFGSVLIGSAIAVYGGINNFTPIGVGTLASVLLTGIFVYLLEIPVIGLIRFGYIASFFFKGDITVLKINELEDPSGLNLTLTLVFGLMLLTYDLFIDEDPTPVFSFVFWLLFSGLFVFAAISVVFAGPDLLGGFSLLSLFISILLAYVTASHFGRRERLTSLLLSLGLGLIFTGIVAMSQYTVEFPVNLPNFGTGTEEELLGTQSQQLSRVPAFLRTPTEMAWVVTTLIPVVFAPIVFQIRSLDVKQRLFLIAATLTGCTAVILSLARGSWIGLAIAIVILTLVGWQKTPKHEVRGYLVGVFASIIISAALIAPFAPRIYDRLTEDDEGSAHIRVPLMETALRMIDDNPLVGVGLNGYRTHMTRYDETGIFVSQVFSNPVHNIFAHITAEVGIPGSIIFCLLILFSIYEAFKCAGSRDRLVSALAIGLGIGMIAFVISGTKEPGSLGSVRPPIRTCFFVIGSILALKRIRLRQIGDFR